MYFAGFFQSLMWKEFTPEGVLAHPNFLETVIEIFPAYYTRAIGGSLFILGALIMIYNLYRTTKTGVFEAEEPASAPALVEEEHKGEKKEHWHRWIEKRPVQLMLLSLLVILIGGLVEMMPTFLVKSNIKTISTVKPYTPLELEGRDIYIREGCYNCHSQMVRPFRSETARYGEYSKAGEFVYDHPFQWGSKRTGPDLAREGGKQPDSWHFKHMYDPRSVSQGSVMPPYPWLITDKLDVSKTADKIKAMQTLGVPYPKDYDAIALDDLRKQAKEIEGRLEEEMKKDNVDVDSETEIIALIAYLQRLGVDISKGKQ
jgi:cytochrome c oxidase cbb3-type subunit I/II